MKKMINTSFAYLIAGLISGVFYREFTKFNGFTGETTLRAMHPHLLVLGMLVFLLVVLFMKSFNIKEDGRIKKFYIFYNIGVIGTVLMLAARGITQVLNSPLSKGANAAISGMSGIFHIVLTIGIMFFFTELKHKIKD